MDNPEGCVALGFSPEEPALVLGRPFRSKTTTSHFRKKMPPRKKKRSQKMVEALPERRQQPYPEIVRIESSSGLALVGAS